jgi:hypothetical protein
MNKLKFTFWVVLLLFNCNSKISKNEKKELNEMNNSEINKHIEGFEDRPFYQAKIKTSGVGFDVRINDYPILQFNKATGGGTEMEIPINPAILSSGKQNLSIKVFPILGHSVIAEDGVFEIEINKKKDAWVYDGERDVILQNIKMKNLQNNPMWEYQATFDANVPYSFIAWNNSRDLSKIDDLNQLLDDAYKKLAIAIESKDDAEFTKLVKDASQVDIMLYEKQNGIIGFQPEPEKILPMDGCNLKLYGNNKLVRYETIELESCLKSEIDLGNNEKEIYTYPIFFHLPQGANELKIIR